MSMDDMFEGLDKYFTDVTKKYNLIESLLPTFVENDIGVTESMSIFREAGFTFTDSVFRDLYRNVTGETVRSGRIKYVGLDSVPTDAVFDNPSYAQTAKYRYRLEYEVESFDGETTEKRYFDHDTNVKGTIRQIQDEAFTVLNERYPITDGEIVRYRVKAAWIDTRYS